MSRIQTIARALAPAIAAALTCGGGANAASLTEGFDDVSLLFSPSGWKQKNNSTSIGDQPDWLQGGEGTFPFLAHEGLEVTSYISVDYQSTANKAGVDTISNWLITPKQSFNNGDVLEFYTRTVSDNPYADRLQVRFGTGAAPSPGVGAFSVGDFTTVLVDINPAYAIDFYPETWTKYTATITGLSGARDGAIAFRYFVEDGGSGGDNSNFIGIDTVSIIAAPVLAVPEPAAYLMMALGLGVIGLRRMRG